MIITCAHVVAPMAHVRHVLEWAEGVAEYRVVLCSLHYEYDVSPDVVVALL